MNISIKYELKKLLYTLFYVISILIYCQFIYYIDLRQINFIIMFSKERKYLQFLIILFIEMKVKIL